LTKTKPNPDTNDRNAHVLCTDQGENQSIFRFVEIFNIDENETPAPGDKFIVSWINALPFVERSRKYTYMRRPSCSVKKDECSNTQIVNGCNDNAVLLDDGFVKSRDRIYFIPPNTEVHGCKFNGACCPYVNIYDGGICGGTIDPLCPSITPCIIRTFNPNTYKCDETPKCVSNDLCVKALCEPTNGTCVNIPACYDGRGCTYDVCNKNSTNFWCEYTYNCNNGNSADCDYCEEKEVPKCTLNGQFPIGANVFITSEYCQPDLTIPTQAAHKAYMAANQYCTYSPKSGNPLTCPSPANQGTTIFLQ